MEFRGPQNPRAQHGRPEHPGVGKGIRRPDLLGHRQHHQPGSHLAIRLQDAGNGYLILFAPAHTPVPWNRTGFVAIIKMVSGTETTLATYNKRKLSTLGQTAKIKVIARGPAIQVLLNGTKILETNDSTYATGRIGLRIFGDPNYPCDATFSGIAFH